MNILHENKHYYFSFFSNYLFSQSLDEVNNSLKSLNLADFYKKYEILTSNVKRIEEKWGYRRQLTKNYYEEVNFFFREESITNGRNCATYKIAIVSKDSQIISYKLQVSHSRLRRRRFKISYECIDSFKNENLFVDFKNEFKFLFSENLNEQELFERDLTFGDFCSFGGIETPGHKKISEFVRQSDTIKLNQWLRSTNTEKQLFGVLGFYLLQKKGYKLKKEELDLVKFIVNKNGTVDYCSGCMYYEGEVKSIMKKFGF